MKAISNYVNHIKNAGLAVGAAAVASAVIFSSALNAKAYEKYEADQYVKDSSTGYEAYIFDGGDYLTDSEEADLIDEMKDLLAYSNVIYITDENNYNYSMSYSDGLARYYAHEYFGDYDSAIVYVCDNEYDLIYSQGKVGKTITVAKQNSITDNIYTYSAREQYYKAAHIAFDQCERLLQGRAIAEPMKYICNAFIGLFIGFIVCYLYVSKKSSLKYAGYDEMIAGAISFVEKSDAQARYVSTSRTYSPRSSSSGGHGGGHHGGGHHGGGHSGGHSH